MKRTFWIAICCIVLFAGVVNLPVQAQCSPLPSRLQVGETGVVTPGLANSIRLSPSPDSELLGTIPPGGIFTISGGPECSNGLTYWVVIYEIEPGVRVEGWTAEGDAVSYWLAPINAVDDPPVVQGGDDSVIQPPTNVYEGIVVDLLQSAPFYPWTAGIPPNLIPISFNSGNPQFGNYAGVVQNVRLEDGTVQERAIQVIPDGNQSVEVSNISLQPPALIAGLRFKARVAYARARRSNESAILEVGYIRNFDRARVPLSNYNLLYDGNITEINLDITSVPQDALLYVRATDTNPQFRIPIILVDPRVEAFDPNKVIAPGGCEVFEDFFGGFSQVKWYEGQDNQQRADIIDGAYLIEIYDYPTTQRYPISWGTIQDIRFRDVTIEAQVSSSQFSNDSSTGIWTRYQDGNNFLNFTVNSFGQYRIARFQNGYTDLVTWTQSNAVNTGDFAVNVLRIEERNDQFDFYINGQYVNTVFDNTWLDGRVGFFGSTPNRPAQYYLERISICSNAVTG